MLLLDFLYQGIILVLVILLQLFLVAYLLPYGENFNYRPILNLVLMLLVESMFAVVKITQSY